MKITFVVLSINLYYNHTIFSIIENRNWRDATRTMIYYDAKATRLLSLVHKQQQQYFLLFDSCWLLLDREGSGGTCAALITAQLILFPRLFRCRWPMGHQIVGRKLRISAGYCSSRSRMSSSCIIYSQI